MCRHFAYIGPPATLRSLLIDPAYGLYRQSWAPRCQEHGTVNADGFGVGWYSGGDPVPARYRRSVPMWTDPSFKDVARVTASGAVLAAVRDATPGTAQGEAAVAPFASGRWLFSHNGIVNGWPGSPAVAALAGTLGTGSLLSLEAQVDSALLWAMALDRLRAGLGATEALASVVTDLAAAGVTGRFNFLLTDGESIAATASGDTLWYLQGPDATWVASEPCDESPDWVRLPDGHALTATARRVTVTGIDATGVNETRINETRIIETGINERIVKCE